MLGTVGCNAQMDEAEQSTTKTSSFFTEVKKEQEKDITLEGLCEILEKKDVSKEVCYNSFHRMASRMVDVETSLFCIDSDTGVVYFANKGKDSYLYRMKEGEVELAVAIPVKEIYTYGESVYFMIENYGKYDLKDMHNGDIYSYTPKTGIVQLIYPAGNIEGATGHKLMVDSSGIYFSYEIYKDTMSDIKVWAYNYRRVYGKLGLSDLAWVNRSVVLFNTSKLLSVDKTEKEGFEPSRRSPDLHP